MRYADSGAVADSRAQTTRQEKLGRFTEVPSEQPQPPEVVVVVPPHAELVVGFELARKFLGITRGVRLVGLGVTLRRTWPSWVYSAPGLSLTELGAYTQGTQAEATTPLRHSIRRWLDATLSEALRGIPADRAFYWAGATRLFQSMLDAYPQAVGLLEAHPTASFVFVGDWSGKRILCSLRPGSLREETISARIRDVVTSVGWKPRLFFFGVCATAAALVVASRDYFEARHSYRRLRELRSRSQPMPRTWITLVPDWPRINSHVLDSIAKQELIEHQALGVLLIASLGRGERLESNLSSGGTLLWPGIAPIAAYLDRCVVDQAVLPESPVAFLRGMFEGIRGAASALLRIANHRSLDVNSAKIDLAANTGGLVRLATIDIVRAAMAREAARAVTHRHNFQDLPVIFPAAGPTPIAAVDLTLQQAGATTYHFAHGCHFDDPVGGGEHSAMFQCAWTNADARSRAGLHERIIVAGMPARLRSRRLDASGQTRHVLILSGYSHRDYVNRFRLEVFQDELLNIVRLLSAGTADLSFRWRPHPADNRESIRRTQRRLGLTSLELSWGKPLEADIEWADIVVSNLSTVVCECLLVDLAVFVHCLPQAYGLPATSFLHPARTFFHAEEGARKIHAYLTWPDDGPERQGRWTLWGISSRPASLLLHIHGTRNA